MSPAVVVHGYRSTSVQLITVCPECNQLNRAITAVRLAERWAVGAVCDFTSPRVVGTTHTSAVQNTPPAIVTAKGTPQPSSAAEKAAYTRRIAAYIATYTLSVITVKATFTICEVATSTDFAKHGTLDFVAEITADTVNKHTG